MVNHAGGWNGVWSGRFHPVPGANAFRHALETAGDSNAPSLLGALPVRLGDALATGDVWLAAMIAKRRVNCQCWGRRGAGVAAGSPCSPGALFVPETPGNGNGRGSSQAHSAKSGHRNAPTIDGRVSGPLWTAANHTGGTAAWFSGMLVWWPDFRKAPEGYPGATKG